MAGNINDCLADTNCIGMVENVDTRKVVVGVENEGVLNTLKINDIVVLGGSNSDEKLIGILTKVTKKKLNLMKQSRQKTYCIQITAVSLIWWEVFTINMVLEVRINSREQLIHILK